MVFEGYCSVDSERCVDSAAVEVELVAESLARRSPRYSSGSFGAAGVGRADASDDSRSEADADGVDALWCYLERSYASALTNFAITDLNFQEKVADSVCGLMVDEIGE